MRTLVTGSSGYVGSVLIPALLMEGYEVVGIDRVLPASPARYEFIRGDLRDERLLQGLLSDIDLIIHLAAARVDWGLPADAFYRDNSEATRTLIKAGKRQGVKRWLFYSTVGVYGPSDQGLDESAPLTPVIPYGASKAEAERLFNEYAMEVKDAEIIILRPSVIFGPGNPTNTNIFRLIDAIYRNRFIMIGDGTARKTTSHHSNLVPATLFLLEQLAPGIRTFNYVDEPVLTTDELVSELYSLLGKEGPRIRLPLGVAKPLAYVADIAAVTTGVDFPITAARIEKFCTSTNFDGTAIRECGFVQPVSIWEALGDTVQWYLNEYMAV